MKKLLSLSASLLLALSLNACGPTPNAADPADNNSGGNDGGATVDTDVSLGSISKAQYITLLNCYKTSAAIAANPQAAASIDAAINAVNNIPDATWNAAVQAGGAAYQAQFDAAIKAGCSL